jgi:hypothetical protein
LFSSFVSIFSACTVPGDEANCLSRIKKYKGNTSQKQLGEDVHRRLLTAQIKKIWTPLAKNGSVENG